MLSIDIIIHAHAHPSRASRAAPKASSRAFRVFIKSTLDDGRVVGIKINPPTRRATPPTTTTTTSGAIARAQ